MDARMLWAWGLVLLATGSSCNILIGIDKEYRLAEEPGGTGGMSGASSSSGSGASTSSSGGMGGGGAGGGTVCSAPTECPGEDTACGNRTCTDGVCGMMPLLAMGPSPSQLYGDCKVVVCDGAGNATTTLDSGDAYDDTNECTDDVCDFGTMKHVPRAQGATCANGMLACDGAGKCVQCYDASQCGGGSCVSGKCIAAQCANNVKDAGESDVDCGVSCLPCEEGKTCSGSSSCASKVCSTGVCQAPACMDGATNGTETDFDCGGSCNPCEPGFYCKIPSDCDSGVCVQGTCFPPSCNDGVVNGEETGSDCGGAECPPCP